MCVPYKSLKTISGLAKPTSNHFLSLQFAYHSFILSSFFSLGLTSYYFLLFSLNRVSVSRESSARTVVQNHLPAYYGPELRTVDAGWVNTMY